jgi:hypothetical protein
VLRLRSVILTPLQYAYMQLATQFRQTSKVLRKAAWMTAISLSVAMQKTSALSGVCLFRKALALGLLFFNVFTATDRTQQMCGAPSFSSK